MDPLLAPRDECPGCGSRAGELLFSTPYVASDIWSMLTRWYPPIEAHKDAFAGHAYEAVECRSCSLIFQRMLPSSALLGKLYGEWLPAARHPNDDPSFAFDICHPRTTRPAQELHAFARATGKPISALRVLDFGMGWGRWAICVGRTGAQSFGFDLSEAGCEFARAAGVQIVRASEFPTLGADIVNCDQTLEHVPHPRETLRALASALRPGGILKVSVPQAKDLADRFPKRDFEGKAGARNSLNPLHPLEHLQCWNRTSLDAAANEFGLKPRRVPIRAELAFFLSLGPTDLRHPKPVLRAAVRPAYNRLSRHNLYAWYEKT